MKLEYVIKPKDLDSFARTDIGMRLQFNWTDKTDLVIYVPENKVWGLVACIEQSYMEEDDIPEPEGLIV